MAIETALLIRPVFNLPHRQTQGFITALVKALGTASAVSDFSSLFKRSISLPKHELAKGLEPGSIVIVDSTGLKVYGKDEWHQEKHNVAARRTWRKLHLAVDENHLVLALN
jgi:hypothetical protein